MTEAREGARYHECCGMIDKCGGGGLCTSEWVGKLGRSIPLAFHKMGKLAYL